MTEDVEALKGLTLRNPVSAKPPVHQGPTELFFR